MVKYELEYQYFDTLILLFEIILNIYVLITLGKEENEKINL